MARKSEPGTRKQSSGVHVAFPPDVVKKFRESCKSGGFIQMVLCRRWVEGWLKMTPAERVAFYHGNHE